EPHDWRLQTYAHKAAVALVSATPLRAHGDELTGRQPKHLGRRASGAHERCLTHHPSHVLAMTRAGRGRSGTVQTSRTPLEVAAGAGGARSAVPTPRAELAARPARSRQLLAIMAAVAAELAATAASCASSTMRYCPNIASRGNSGA